MEACFLEQSDYQWSPVREVGCYQVTNILYRQQYLHGIRSVTNVLGQTQSHGGGGGCY